MTLHVPRLPFALDPLIAEAKRRMRRRRSLGVLALALVGTAIGLTLGLQAPSGHSLQLAPTSRLGIAHIPGMTLVSSDHSTELCPRKTAGLVTQLCGGYDVTNGLDQTWALTAAVARYGVHRAGAVPPVAFARRHPGPAIVTVQVRTLYAWQGRDLAEKLLHETEYTGSDSSDYISQQGWAINRGLAGEMTGIALNGMKEFRFAWASRASVVMVNVLGAELTAGEAQQVAALAGPSS